MAFDLLLNFPATMRPQETAPLIVEVPAAKRSGGQAPPGTIITLRPVIPGALVVPAELSLDAGKPGSRATFHVTPVGKGRLPEPRVEIYHGGVLAQQLKMRMKAVTQRRTWWLLLATFLLPALLIYLTRYHVMSGQVPAYRTRPDLLKKNAEDLKRGPGDQDQDGDKPAPGKPGPGKPGGGKPGGGKPGGGKPDAGKPGGPPDPGKPAPPAPDGKAGAGVGTLEEVLFEGSTEAVAAPVQADEPGKPDRPAGDKPAGDKPAGDKPGFGPKPGGPPPGMMPGVPPGMMPPGGPAPPLPAPMGPLQEDNEGKEEYMRTGSPDEVMAYQVRRVLRDNVPEFPSSKRVFDTVAEWIGWFYGLLCSWAVDVRPAFWLGVALLLLTFASWLSRRRVRLKVRRTVTLTHQA